MKKIKKILLLAGLSMTLSGCDVLAGLFGGGEKVDATLYHLKLSYCDLVSGQEGFDQSLLTAQYAFGEDGSEHTLDQDSIDEYMQAGETEEDIAKHGQRQEDGSYYFFSGDPMFIEAPKVDGYVFLGFFEKGSTSEQFTFNNRQYVDHLTGELVTPRWNMEDKDIELEARYEVLKYTINYDNDVKEYGLNGNLANGTVYNTLTDDPFTLKTPVEPHGMHFVRWYYAKDNGNAFNPDARQTFETITELPRGEHDAIYTTSSGYAITLFAEYSYEEYDFTFDYHKATVGTDSVAVERDEVCEYLKISGNNTTVAGNKIDLDSDTKVVFINVGDEVTISYDSWAVIYVKPTQGYYLWFTLFNGTRIDGGYADEDGYYLVYLYNEDILNDSSLVFVFAEGEVPQPQA